MPRFRTSYSLTPPKPRFAPDFIQVRDAYRAADFDLVCEGAIRFVVRSDGEAIAALRSVADARAWLESRAQTLAGGARR